VSEERKRHEHPIPLVELHGCPKCVVAETLSFLSEAQAMSEERGVAMGQPSDPGSDPAESESSDKAVEIGLQLHRDRTQRWRTGRSIGRTIYAEGAEQPLAVTLGADEEAKRLAVHIVAIHNAGPVPAGGLVAELEAERARADEAERELAHYKHGMRDTDFTALQARAEQVEKERDAYLARLNEVNVERQRQEVRAIEAERSAVPTATVTQEMIEKGASALATDHDYNPNAIPAQLWAAVAARYRRDAKTVLEAALAEHPRPGDGE
jgi:hypothetical protein